MISLQTDDDDDDDSDESDSDEDDDLDLDNIKELRVDIEPILDEKPYHDLHAAPAYYRHEKLVQGEVGAKLIWDSCYVKSQTSRAMPWFLHTAVLAVTSWCL